MPARSPIKQFVLDANVLIDGVFNPFSYSSRVLEHVIKHDIVGCVLDQTIEEARDVIQAAGSRTGVFLIDHFDRVLNDLPLRELRPITKKEISRFIHIGGENDGAIAAVAVRDGIVVCTQDDDFYKAKQVGTSVMNPVETVLAANNYEMGMYVNLPGFICTPREGAIYIEAETGWGDFANFVNRTGLWDVFDAPELGVLYLDIESGDLTFSIDGGPTASVSLKDIPAGEQLLKIVVSYNVDTGISIYRGHGKPREILSCQWTPANCRLTEKVTVFSGRHGGFGAPARIKLMAGFAKSVSEKAANKMLSGKQPLIPQERFTLDEIIELYYS